MLFTCLLASIPFAGADAVMRSRAVEASSLAQFYIERDGVRVELEIGLDAVEGFRNLMPDAIYERLGHPPRPLGERLAEFFARDLALSAGGEPLTGLVADIGPSKRILRDPINGTPLPVQDEAPPVIRAELQFPFPDGDPPTELVFSAPRGIDVGFVVYHQGVAVNDYRYLGPGYTLTLDWQDPWYSRFNTRSLMRQYSAPMSGFIYVEHFEVRKEIIVRPKDLQRWVDLGLAGRDQIPVEMQPDILERVGRFLGDHQPVRIDGQPLKGSLQRINFLERTLTSSRVIDPPEPLSLDSAIIGAIFVYPREGLPQSVVMEWDLWDERVQRIPVSAVDQAGPLPSFLERDWPELEWKNYLKNPDLPTLVAVEDPLAGWRLWAGHLPLPLALLAIACLAWAITRGRAGRPLTMPIGLAVMLGTSAIAASQLGGDNRPRDARAEQIVADLLHNIYRAFEYREEGDIYDTLQRSVSGELLTDIFLETKRSLVLANQGGAEARVAAVALESVADQPAGEQNSFRVEADWTVHGSVGHWGHVHQRSNRYRALLTMAVDEGRWKLTEMTVLEEERL